MKRTSKSYVCTIETDAIDYDSKLADIRLTVKTMNAILKAEHECSKKWDRGYSAQLKQYRVALRGRKPILKEKSIDRWTGKISIRGFNYGGDVIGGLKNAGAVDVYIYKR